MIRLLQTHTRSRARPVDSLTILPRYSKRAPGFTAHRPDRHSGPIEEVA
jgi:hypothetical protein